MFSLSVLLLEMWVLKKIFPGKSSPVKRVRDESTESEDRRQATDGGGQKEVIHHPLFVIKHVFNPPQFIVAVVLLSVTLVFSQGIEFRERIPLNQPFSGFPTEIGRWKGSRGALDQSSINSLDLSDYVIIDYQNGQKERVNFYVVYYESQRKGKSIHSPATCFSGGGWIFKQTGEVDIPVAARSKNSMTVNRALVQKDATRELSYYWFPQRNRILTNAYQLKWYTFWDALTRQRTDGALVRVMTPVYEDEDLRDTEERLRGFLGEVVPVLDEYLP
jgi:EpsI family protein